MSCPCITDCIRVQCLQTPTYCGHPCLVTIGSIEGYDTNVNVYLKSLSTGTQILIETETEAGQVEIELSEGMINGSDEYKLWITLPNSNEPITFSIIGQEDVTCIRFVFQDVWQNGFRFCEPIQTIVL